jgi:hypothetical protein
MPQSPIITPKPLPRISISFVDVVSTFFEHSSKLGYDAEVVSSYWDDVTSLVQLWSKQGFIEVYTDNADRRYGRVKESSSVPGSVPWYLGIYHARVLKNKNDPLLVLTVEEEKKHGVAKSVLVLQFLIDHDDMFGALGKQKKDTSIMKAIRIRNRNLITRER